MPLQQEYDDVVVKFSKAKDEKEVKRSLHEKEKKQINANCESKGKALAKELADFKMRQKSEKINSPSSVD